MTDEFDMIEIENDWIVRCNKIGMSRNDVVELLNIYKKENKQLKHDATVLIQANQDYRRKNEQLKKELHISDECETISIENSLRLSDEILDLQKKCSELTDTLTAQVEKNIDLSIEVNQLRIENMRLKELQK